MRMEPLLIGLLIFSVVILGLGTFYDEVGTGYNVTTEDISRYSQGEYVRDYGEFMQNESADLETKPTDFVFLIRMPYTIAKQFVQSTGHFINATTSFTEMEELGMPFWVSTTIVSLIFIIVTFALLRAIWEKRL